jgi:hypothetical protein
MLPTPENGSEIKAHIEYHDGTSLVLCKWGREWVTWDMNKKGYCHIGHYFTNPIDGLKDFTDRIQEQRMGK